MTFSSSNDHSFFKELLYLEQDGELDSGDRRKLKAHLVDCRDCRREQRQVTALGLLMQEAAIPVDEQFSLQVMKRLPEAAWEARSPAGWRLAVAVLVLLGVGSVLLALGGEGIAGGLPVAGTAMALAGLFRSALVAGGGLLAASWTGIGLALDEVLEGSRVAFTIFGMLVLGIDVLFIRLLMKKQSASAEVPATRARDGDSSS